MENGFSYQFKGELNFCFNDCSWKLRQIEFGKSNQRIFQMYDAFTAQIPLFLILSPSALSNLLIFNFILFASLVEICRTNWRQMGLVIIVLADVTTRAILKTAVVLGWLWWIAFVCVRCLRIMCGTLSTDIILSISGELKFKLVFLLASLIEFEASFFMYSSRQTDHLRRFPWVTRYFWAHSQIFAQNLSRGKWNLIVVRLAGVHNYFRPLIGFLSTHSIQSFNENAMTWKTIFPLRRKKNFIEGGERK